MDSARREQLDSIIRMSKEMLELAEELEWEKIALLEVQRKQIVVECFRQPAKEEDAAEVAMAIREILHLNQQVTALGKQSQGRLGSEIHNHNRGRAATSAYLSHTR